MIEEDAPLVLVDGVLLVEGTVDVGVALSFFTGDFPKMMRRLRGMGCQGWR